MRPSLLLSTPLLRSSLLAVVVAGAVACPTAAHARVSGAILVAKAKKKKKKGFAKGDKVVVSDETAVRQKPSKKGEELYTAKEGEEMTVIAVSDDGAWVRIKDKDGSKGWLSADAIAGGGGDEADAADGGDEGGGDEEEAPPPPKPKKPPKPKRPHKPKPKPEPEPEPEIDMSGGGDDGGDAGDGEKVAKNDEGDGGDENVAKSAGGEGEGDGDGGGDGDVAASAAAKRMRFAAFADLALLARSVSFTSMGTGIVGNYKLSNSAPALSLVGGVRKQVGGKYDVGLDLGYLMTVGGSGIAVMDPSAPMGSKALAWSAKAIDVRGVVGYPLSPKFDVAGRLGYHRAATTVDDSTIVKLPSERLGGFTVGLGLDAKQLTPKIAARASVETMLGASLLQNSGRKDGDSASVSAYYVNLSATYMINKSFDAIVAYTLSYESYGFKGTSQRDAAASNGSRSDLQHVIGVGVLYRR